MNRLLLIPCLVLFGCAQSNQLRLAAYVETDHARYAGPGTASISGQAFARAADGDVKFAAGSNVVLFPATPYTDEHWTRAVVGGQELAPMDSGVVAVTRVATGDGEGRFEFRGLPAGDYYVHTGVTWTERWPTTESHVVKLGQKVSLADGQDLKLILPVILKPPSNARPKTQLGSR
jgi:hypothetical protein